MKIANQTLFEKFAPESLDALRNYWSASTGVIEFRSTDLGNTLEQAEQLKDCLEIVKEDVLALASDVHKCPDDAMNPARQSVIRELKDYANRLADCIDNDTRINLPPPGNGEAIRDELGNHVTLDRHRQASELSEFEPLSRDQRMSDWCHKFVRSEDLGDLKLGGYVRAWLTGEHNQQTRRTMTSTGTGGVLIPTPLAAEVIDLARNKSRVLTAGAVVWPMDSATLTVPRQTGDASAAWRPELGHIHRTGISLEPVVLKSCSLGALVTLSRELLEDAIGLNSFLTRTLSNVMAEGIDQAALSGAGAVDSETSERIEPVGVLNTADVQVIDLSAALDSYAPFSQAVTRVRQVNGEPSGLMMAPVNFGLLDALTATDGQPLMPPASWSQVRHYDTNQLDEHTAIVGDWSQLAIGVRHSLRLEYATTGQIPKEGIQEELSLFSQNAIAIRVLWRGDVAVQRPDQFVKIINMNPAPESASTESATRKKDKVA